MLNCLDLDRLTATYLCNRDESRFVARERDEDETIVWTGEFPKDEWYGWTETVPRTVNLEDRLAQLIALERSVSEQGGELETVVAEWEDSE